MSGVVVAGFIERMLARSRRSGDEQAFPRRIQFLLDSLRVLERNLAALGSRLVVVSGKSVDLVPRLARLWKADRVLARRWVEPVGREGDRRVRNVLGERFQLYEGEMLAPPETLRTGAGKPYSVFGGFARAFGHIVAVDKPLAPPRSLPPVPRDVAAETVPIPSATTSASRPIPTCSPAARRKRTRDCADSCGSRCRTTSRYILVQGKHPKTC